MTDCLQLTGSLTTLNNPKESKRWKIMKQIKNDILPEHWALAWIRIGKEARNNPVCSMLKTGLNLNPSLEEVIFINDEIAKEYYQVSICLRNHGSFKRESNLSYVNFMRDMLEIPDIAMIRMRRILATCKCCELHQCRRPVCQEKKRRLDYEIFSQPENDCKCTCRHFMRKLEQALTNMDQLKIKGQFWERSV